MSPLFSVRIAVHSVYRASVGVCASFHLGFDGVVGFDCISAWSLPTCIIFPIQFRRKLSKLAIAAWAEGKENGSKILAK